MPKINVYLPDDLANAVRSAGVPVSAVCQRALADAVVAHDGTHEPVAGQAAAAGIGHLRDRLTQRAERAIELGTNGAGGNPPTSVELLAGVVEEGNNLALAVLKGLDIDTEDLLDELRATRNAGQHTGASNLDEIRDRAAHIALALDTNFIGCEHLLTAIAEGSANDPAAATLNTLGIGAEKCRDLVRAALTGMTYAQANLSLSGLSAPVRSALEEISQRLGRLEQRAG